MKIEKNNMLIGLVIMVILLSNVVVVYALTYTAVYSNTVNNSGEKLGGRNAPDFYLFEGEKITSTSALLDVTIQKVQIELRCSKTSSGSLNGGTAYLGVWNTANGAPTLDNKKIIIASFNPQTYLNCGTAPPASASYNFTIPKSAGSKYTFEANDVIGIFYTYTSDGTSTWISTRYSTTDQFDGANTLDAKYGPNTSPAWVTTSTRDATAKYFQLGSGNIVGGVDCDDPARQETLLCRQNEIGNGQLGSFSDLIGQSFGNGTNNLFVQLGLVEEGSDIKTNGVGYAFVVIGLGIMTAIFFLATGGDLRQIPTFVWFLGALSVVGGLAGFGYIEPLYFIIAILIIIALATAKILNTLEIGGFR